MNRSLPSRSSRAAAPGRHRPEADGLRRATASPKGLAVSGLSPKQGPTKGHAGAPSWLVEGRSTYPAIGGLS